MAQVIYADDAFHPVDVELEERYISESERLKKERKELLDERRKLKKDKIELEKQLSEYAVRKKLDEKMMSSQKQLFEKKFKILELELQKLAEEKARLEKEKNFYKAVNDNLEGEKNTDPAEVRMLFRGIDNLKDLKKRYKELIKIFHPDNVNGDTSVLQEINRQFDELKSKY
ncbi:MAG: molecular chaperone DnaJ [Lachnospiraceae bacterium]|nr:molecular chaperone DnaJ [Lachnospiraceae bacterium]